MAPVNRNSNENKVSVVAKIFNQKDAFRMAIALTGWFFRALEKKWISLKAGFYYIALEAEIPVLLVHFNYPHKKISFLKLFYPTGDIDNDIKEMKDYFKRAE